MNRQGSFLVSRGHTHFGNGCGHARLVVSMHGIFSQTCIKCPFRVVQVQPGLTAVSEGPGVSYI